MKDIERLKEGNRIFRERFFSEERALFEELAQGQQPKIALVTCCDSRVDPAIIFNCQPGDLFVVRNVANLVPPCEKNDTYHGTSAALEFAVCFLRVKHIIVLGHTQCGGIRALLEQGADIAHNQASFIAKWMQLARPAYDKIMAEHAQASMDEKIVLCEQYALLNSLNNLRTFRWVTENADIQLHAWYFDIRTGLVHVYDKSQEEWRSL